MQSKTIMIREGTTAEDTTSIYRRHGLLPEGKAMPTQFALNSAASRQLTHCSYQSPSSGSTGFIMTPGGPAALKTNNTYGSIDILSVTLVMKAVTNTGHNIPQSGRTNQPIHPLRTY